MNNHNWTWALSQPAGTALKVDVWPAGFTAAQDAHGNWHWLTGWSAGARFNPSDAARAATTWGPA